MMCNHCFENEQIKEYIQNNGDRVEINHLCLKCQTTNKDIDMYLLSKVDLAYKLQEVIANLYTHYDEHGIHIGLDSLNEICWELFEDGDKLSKMIVEHPYLSDIADGGSLDFTDEYNEVWLKKCFFEQDEHVSFNWNHFSDKIKHSLRFFDIGSFNRLYELQKLDMVFSKLNCASNSPKIVYRARVADKSKVDTIKQNPKNELGKAPSKYAGHNRFSPSGISYVYLAYDKKTAISEVFNPNKELYCVGEFELYENLKLLCLSKKMYQLLEDYYTDPWMDEDRFDAHLYCNAKSLELFISEIQKPINNYDKSLEYLPTQILAEYIKLQGYDGFTFSSTKNEEGINLVLFEEKITFKSYEEKEVHMHILIKEN